jgi:acetolactate synthase-1/2/3 large subunit
VKDFARGKCIAHVDIDPTEIDKTYPRIWHLVATLGDFFEHALAFPGRAGS